jgi:hypothetical protein
MSVLFLSIALAAAPQASATETRLIQQRYGDCVIQDNAREARAFILDHMNNSRNTPTGRLVEKLNNGPCLYKAAGNLPGRMQMPGDTMRYALADSLIRRELLSGSPLGDVSGIAPLAHPVVDADAIMKSPVAVGGKDGQLERERRLAVAQAVTAMSQLGECVVRRSPTQALQLFRTNVGSAEETTAFSALNPAISACVPAGSTVELTKASLRGTIGVNYYRLANAPRSATAAQGTAR